jgi:Tfp pilus assembly protein PilE
MSSQSRRSGLTRVDLLFATAVLGVLAAIVVGNVRNTRSSANLELVRNDLRELQVVEERYFGQNTRYATDTTQLAWKSRPEVTVAITSTDPTIGFEAVGQHKALPGVTCRLYVGRAPDRKSGVIDCSSP